MCAHVCYRFMHLGVYEEKGTPNIEPQKGGFPYTTYTRSKDPESPIESPYEKAKNRRSSVAPFSLVFLDQGSLIFVTVGGNILHV